MEALALGAADSGRALAFRIAGRCVGELVERVRDAFRAAAASLLNMGRARSRVCRLGAGGLVSGGNAEFVRSSFDECCVVTGVRSAA
jgi:hypothetical protein